MNPRIPPANSRNNTPGRFLVVALVSAGLLLSGCTTMQSVAVPTQGAQVASVHAGDDVQVQTKGGQTISFVVTQVEPDALTGKDVRVKFEAIAGVQVKRVDKMQTAKVGAGVVGVALLVALAVGLSKMGPGLGP
jgi:uncharacterized protein YceK